MAVISMRREERHPLRADIRVIAEGKSLAVLTTFDISASGVGTDGLIQLEPETIVRIEFPDGTIRNGRAMWRDDFASGILFERALTPEELATMRASLAAFPYFDER